MLSDKEKAEIKEAYIKGEAIQTIARHYRVGVNEVLHLIGQDEMLTITTQGDMIDDAGPGATLNYGSQFPITYTTD